jgi:predicted amidophosphoribosyltransferase
VGSEKFCANCGTKLATDHCTQCGAELPTGARFCGNCGTKAG